MKTNEKKRLERQIQIYSFAVYEAALYLDSHKCDSRALSYYNNANAKLKALTESYEKSFGPLTIHGNTGDSWSWTDGAWPWEYDAN